MGVAQRPITTVAAYVALIFIFPPSLLPCLPACLPHLSLRPLFFLLLLLFRLVRVCAFIIIATCDRYAAAAAASSHRITQCDGGIYPLPCHIHSGP